MEEILEKLLTESPWLIVLFLSIVNERLIEATVKKVFEKFEWDKWWLIPISWVTGCGIGAMTTLNLFPGIFRWEVAGWAVTSILIGGGSNLIHEVYSIASGLKELLRMRANGK